VSVKNLKRGEVMWCIVLTCPRCGKQRPYPIPESIKSVEDVRRNINVRLRLSMGFREHYVYCGGETPSDELVEEIIGKGKLMHVPEHIVSEVEKKSKEAKWDYYGLS